MTNSDLLLRNATLERELVWAHLKIQVLEERLRKQRIGILGPKSETLSNLQLQLLVEEEPSVTVEEVEAEAGREPMAPKPRRERKAHPGRVRLPENLPRVEQTLTLSARIKPVVRAANRPPSSATMKARCWMCSRPVTSYVSPNGKSALAVTVRKAR